MKKVVAAYTKGAKTMDDVTYIIRSEEERIFEFDYHGKHIVVTDSESMGAPEDDYNFSNTLEEVKDDFEEGFNTFDGEYEKTRSAKSEYKITIRRRARLATKEEIEAING